jgi:hypothetical protein
VIAAAMSAQGYATIVRVSPICYASNPSASYKADHQIKWKLDQSLGKRLAIWKIKKI